MNKLQPQCVLSLEELQATISRCPFNRWLGLKVISVSDQGIELFLPWRDELLSSPEAQSMHGGILASLIDAAGDYACGALVGRGLPTIDLRVDYHKAAKPGDYIAKGRVIQLGRTISTGEAHVYDVEGTLVASGRGAYFSGQPAPRPASD